VRIAENNKYGMYLWGKTTYVLMSNLVVHRETTRSLTALDAYTFIVQYIHKEHAVTQLVEALLYRPYCRAFDS